MVPRGETLFEILSGRRQGERFWHDAEQPLPFP
jgi:hypothetical protein